MPHSLTINFAQPIALFPLPSCVLLPHATVPLHIFEDRYRKLVADALGGTRLMAMAMFEGDAWKDQYQGRPDIRPVVCVGYIVKHEAMPDGRYHILLQGVCRARVLREMSRSSYRTALVQPIETAGVLEIDLSDHRQRLEGLLHDPLLKQLASVSAVHNWLSDEIPTSVLVDLGIMTTTDGAEERYRMLAQGDVARRARWLCRHLDDLRRTLNLAARFEPARSADGIGLN